VSLFVLGSALFGKRPQFRSYSFEEIVIQVVHLVIWVDLLWVGRKWYALPLGAMFCFQLSTLLMSMAALLPFQSR
jgi:hypothetical protein